MTARSPVLRLAAAIAAILAAGVWQYADMRAHQRDHAREHRQHGLALLDAAEAVAARECKGGRADLDDLTAALEEMRSAFGLEWLAVATTEGETLAGAGTPPERPDARFYFEKRFEPHQPNPLGRGPRRSGNSPLVELPRTLVISLTTPAEPLQSRLGDARTRAIVTASALAIAILLVAGTWWLATRSVALRADLAASRTRLRGLETLRRLGAGLAHETRNPLGVVRGFAERLAHGRIPPEEIPRAARSILEETDRTVARLDEFMLLSRPAELRRTNFDVQELFDELGTLVRPDLESAGATLEVRCGGAELLADRDQIRRLLLNLLLNAVRAISRGGRIELTCEPTDTGRRIIVADDGEGVPEELRATLFEPYVSGRPGGTGLGLSIAQRIAADHGFTLRYERRKPRGTTMILEVPSR